MKKVKRESLLPRTRCCSKIKHPPRENSRGSPQNHPFWSPRASGIWTHFWGPRCNHLALASGIPRPHQLHSIQGDWWPCAKGFDPAVLLLMDKILPSSWDDICYPYSHLWVIYEIFYIYISIPLDSGIYLVYIYIHIIDSQCYILLSWLVGFCPVRRRTKHLMDCQLNKQHTRLRDGTLHMLRVRKAWPTGWYVNAVDACQCKLFGTGTVIPYTALFLDDMVDRLECQEPRFFYCIWNSFCAWGQAQSTSSPNSGKLSHFWTMVQLVQPGRSYMWRVFLESSDSRGFTLNC